MADAHHAEWLALLDISGPFLSPPVLGRVFPQGLDAADSDHTAKLRLAYEEWAEEQHKADPDPAIHDAWIRFIFNEALGLTPEVLLEGEGIPNELEFTSPEHAETIRPDFVVFDPEDEPGTRKPRVLISVWPAGTELDQPVADARWTASPIDRMIALCRSEPVGLRLGLVTNGERWAVVDAPVGETSAHASWYANLWGPEPLTLRAFRSLLALRRFFGVAEKDRLEAMLVESANYQTEVTDQLGFQVRRAVEVLVQSIDRADADTGRTLLADTDPARIYEAALTVMMRLVFLFSAEERGLLRLGDPMYDQFYAVSTLHAQLQEAADLVGPEVLERRQDAWSRLLGTFRAIYGGIHHQDLQIIPYGSSLFDPDRFPFLEGRTDDTTWQDTDSLPLPIDNRTVLLLLRSLQMLDLGKGKGARKLSFRALDIEQIGHVYETLLDHSAYRATEPMVSLQGNQGREPEIPVSKLIDLMLQEGDEPLVEFLKAELKKGVNPIRKALERGRTPEPEAVARLHRAYGGDDILLGKLLPFHDLIRLDPWGDPVVIGEGAVFVTAGEERRSTGTHYTPRALTEEVVRYALEPVVYRGPANGKDRNEWELKSPDEILDLNICDPAMGSGAFLVQACRYLSERLVEAWDQNGQASVDDGSPYPIPTDPEERLSLARRLVADRCLYGVDVNPLAVEMAKLSLWLITLAAEKPFTFLDHALKCGDSLIGARSLEQIRHFHLDAERGRSLHQSLFDPRHHIDRDIADSAVLRRQLESMTVKDIYDARLKRSLHLKAEAATDVVRLLADAIVAAGLAAGSLRGKKLDAELLTLGASLSEWRSESTAGLESLAGYVERHLAAALLGPRRPFHWPVEFPEVFGGSRKGFDALVLNPPFIGGKQIRPALGDAYNAYLKASWNHERGAADLAVFFLLRASTLSRRTIGLVLPDGVRAGASRRVGLMHLLGENSRIYWANTEVEWPGTSNVIVNTVALTKGVYSGRLQLNGSRASAINSRLEDSDVEFEPVDLEENRGLGSEGTHLIGTGFIVDDATATSWLALDPVYRDVLRRYLNARSLMSISDRTPDSWVIDFRDWPDDKARNYSLAWDRVEKLVRPVREGRTGQIHEEAFWRFWDKREELYERVRSLERVLVCPSLSIHPVWAFVPSGWVYSKTLCVVPQDDYWTFGVLQSSWHYLWALKYAHFRDTRIQYSIRDILRTYPLPEGPSREVADAALTYENVRERLLKARDRGLTDLYNEFHRAAPGGDLSELRKCRIELDRAVLGAYGWGDMSSEYGHRDTRQGPRWLPDAETERTILGRLLTLNSDRSQNP